MTQPLVQITDEMVDRFCAEWFDESGGTVGPMTRDMVRKALSCALSPPDEIPVTEEMALVGSRAFARAIHCDESEAHCYTITATEFYRAMESVRRKAEKLERPGVFYQNRGTYREHNRKGEYCDHAHRRKDDPK